MADRREVFDRIRRKEISVTNAAKLLGISRTRIRQLMEKQDAKPAPAPSPAAAPAPRVVQPDPQPSKPASAPASSAATPEVAPAGPVDLKAVLDPVAAAPPAPGATPVEATRIEGVDPDDAEAGRELLGWLRRGMAEFAAKFVYKAKPDDPRLEKLKEENKFLKVALKRNSDKAAPLGWFTRGWVGLAVGFGIEFIRVALTFPPPTSKPSSQTAPAPSPAASVEDAPTAPPTKTVEEVREEIEGRPRLTIEERLRIFNEGKK